MLVCAQRDSRAAFRQFASNEYLLKVEVTWKLPEGGYRRQPSSRLLGRSSQTKGEHCDEPWAMRSPSTYAHSLRAPSHTIYSTARPAMRRDFRRAFSAGHLPDMTQDSLFVYNPAALVNEVNKRRTTFEQI